MRNADRENLKTVYEIIMNERTKSAMNIANPSTNRYKNNTNDRFFEQITKAKLAFDNIFRILDNQKILDRREV